MVHLETEFVLQQTPGKEPDLNHCSNMKHATQPQMQINTGLDWMSLKCLSDDMIS